MKNPLSIKLQFLEALQDLEFNEPIDLEGALDWHFRVQRHFIAFLEHLDYLTPLPHLVVNQTKIITYLLPQGNVISEHIFSLTQTLQDISLTSEPVSLVPSIMLTALTPFISLIQIPYEIHESVEDIDWNFAKDLETEEEVFWCMQDGQFFAMWGLPSMRKVDSDKVVN